MSKPGHYIKVCNICRDVISQCRCPDPAKTIVFGTCAACLVKVAHASQVLDNPDGP